MSKNTSPAPEVVTNDDWQKILKNKTVIYLPSEEEILKEIEEEEKLKNEHKQA